MSELVDYDEALKYIAQALGEFFRDSPEKVAYWLMTPNPMLGNVVPAWLMLSRPNGPGKLKKFIENCKDGNIA